MASGNPAFELSQPLMGQGGSGRDGANAVSPRRNVELSDTMLAAQERRRDGGRSLVSKRIEVAGKGRGTVIDIQSRLGKATRHVVLFDSGKRETLQLGKTGFSGKGYAF